MKKELDWKCYDVIEHASVLDSRFNFQRRFNVVFRLMWRRDVAKCQINVKATSCTSTLKFTTLNNIESTSSISTLIWTILDNVKQHSHFQCRFSQLWSTSKQLCEYDHLNKNIKPWVKNKIVFLSFKEYTGLKTFFSLFPILREICKKIFAETRQFLKHRIYWLKKTILKPSHFVKCQLVFNFTKRKVHAHYDYRSFIFICIF